MLSALCLVQFNVVLMDVSNLLIDPEIDLSVSETYAPRLPP